MGNVGGHHSHSEEGTLGAIRAAAASVPVTLARSYPLGRLSGPPQPSKHLDKRSRGENDAARVVALNGGSHGVRDMGALESALFRPQSGYNEDIVQEACALLESLAINHPFVDGNKRIAFAVMDAFLRINGYRIRARPIAVYNKMIGFFERGEFEMKHLDPYFRKLIAPAAKG